MSIEQVCFQCPNKFLETLHDCVDDYGQLLDKSVEHLVDLMKKSKSMLVPKCLALTIISLSSADVQIKLCESGVWNILFQWLQDGLKDDNTSFIVDILKLYLKLPISFSNLKSNACPKLIKKLTKSGNEDIVVLAKDIYHKWKEVVVEKTKDAVPAKKLKLEEKTMGSVLVEDKKKFTTVKVKNTNMRNATLDEDNNSGKLVKKNDRMMPTTLDEIHQKISDKRKVVEIHESKNFINSITFNTAPPKKKKKRQELPLNKSTSDVSVPEESTSDINNSLLNIPDSPNEKQKKRVSWAPSDSLQTIKYFELDENERVNVNRISIEEMRKKEKLMEKQNVARRHLSDDNDDETCVEKWIKPFLVSSIPDIKLELNSSEKKIQIERERKILKVFYFSKDTLPSTPSEPDNESYDVKEPKIIPLIDSSSQVQVPKQTEDANSKLLIFTEEGNKRQASLHPDVVNILKTMTQNNTNKPANVSTETQPKSDNSESVIKTKIIGILRSKYPDVDPEKLSSEQVCKLLEPMKDQLVREGILTPTSQNVNIPPPNFPAPVRQWFPDHPPPFPHSMPPRPFPNRQIPPTRPFHQRPYNPNRPVCKYFASNGFCRQGNNCSFSHVTPDYPRPYNPNRH